MTNRQPAVPANNDGHYDARSDAYNQIASIYDATFNKPLALAENRVVITYLTQVCFPSPNSMSARSRLRDRAIA
jgi:hypothetical protein